MAKTAYNIQLKGYVCLNAYAATIASLGTAHISIYAGAMYLVHKCSMAFIELSRWLCVSPIPYS